MSRTNSPDDNAHGASEIAGNLKDRASAVGANLRDLGGSIRDSAADVKGAAKEQFEHLRDKASESFEGGRQRVRNWEHGIESYVQEKPIKSLLMAVGAGMLIGMIWKRL